MDSKEKDSAEIEAKLNKFGITINELKTKLQTRAENKPDIKLENFLKKQEAAADKLEELKGARDEKEYTRHKSDLRHMMNDIDEDLREAFAYLMF